MHSRQYLERLFQRTLEHCTPSAAIKKAVSFSKERLVVNNDTAIDATGRPIYVLSVGKASVPMYEGLQEVLGERISGHLIITSDTEKKPEIESNSLLQSSHPLPDEKSLNAGRHATAFVKNVPDNALFLCLISGGMSSLMCLPAEDISINDLRTTFRLLNRSGADIHEINTVRKHCSQIKGGQLLRNVAPGITLVNLMISDVPGDDPAVIGSGPTTPNSTIFRDAYDVLSAYKLWERIPKSIQLYLEKGMTGRVPEIVRPEHGAKIEHHSFVISSASDFARTAADFARKDGYQVSIANKPFTSDVETVASDIAQQVQEIDEKQKSVISFFYGESIIKVTGGGTGGRNQELALHVALKIAGETNSCWLCAGTDGIDGPTDAAGAVIDGQTIPAAIARGVDPQTFLANNDSYRFHSEMDTLLKTGSTGNNLMDVVWVFSFAGDRREGDGKKGYRRKRQR